MDQPDFASDTTSFPSSSGGEIHLHHSVYQARLDCKNQSFGYEASMIFISSTDRKRFAALLIPLAISDCDRICSPPEINDLYPPGNWIHQSSEAMYAISAST
ncbi:MAG: hypothetical protein VX278_09770 [Myxococcota bacterium]|nr:hypothetical protein [Myxococcota bacterium]